MTETVHEPVQEVKKLLTEQELISLAYTSADEYGVSPHKLYQTIKCEAPKKVIDGVVYYDPTAKSEIKGEDSWGLAQWNIPSGNDNFENKKITRQQATDPNYSVDLMASYFADGKQHKWTCYRTHFGRN